MLLINQLGFNFISECVLPFRGYDKRIQMAFSKTGSEKRAQEALCNSLRDLGNKAGQLLHYYPF
jgi:hypothetical protein